MKLISVIFLLAISSCTLLKKDEGSDEMVKMGQMVLKSKEGLEIEIKPIQMDKK